LFDGKGDLVQGIQKKTNMGRSGATLEKVQAVKDQMPFSIVRRAQSPFYSKVYPPGHNAATAPAGWKRKPNEELKAVAKPQGKKPILAEDFGQMHEAYSALLYLSKKYAIHNEVVEKGLRKMVKSSKTLSFPIAADVAGMALIAGTLSAANFGGPLDRIKSLHVAVKLLSAKQGKVYLPPRHDYSGSEGAAYKSLFEQMEKVVDGTTKLSAKVDGLTIQQWFDGGFVGDFRSLLQYKYGSICKQANSFAEFYAYGGVFKASKGEFGDRILDLGAGADASTNPGCAKTFPLERSSCDAKAQASWNAFWRDQPGFVNGVVPMLAGLGISDTDKDKTGRDKAMEAMKQCTGKVRTINRTGGSTFKNGKDVPHAPEMVELFDGGLQIFSTCAAFTQECKFEKGFWQKKK